jgi:hypothetical protein
VLFVCRQAFIVFSQHFVAMAKKPSNMSPRERMRFYAQMLKTARTAEQAQVAQERYEEARRQRERQVRQQN